MKKLATSWNEDDPALAISNDFHDEVEEHDEADEAEDGCDGVRWQLCVLKKPNSSNRMLHELAREIKGVENRRGRKFTSRQYRLIFDKWAGDSERFLRTGQDYFTDLLAKLDCVSVPKGETLQAAFERAKHRNAPCEVAEIQNNKLQLFASLCRELHEMGSGQPIMLVQMSIAKLFGHSHHRNVSNWIRALKTVGILRLVAPARKKTATGQGRAARYLYVAADAHIAESTLLDRQVILNP